MLRATVAVMVYTRARRWLPGDSGDRRVCVAKSRGRSGRRFGPEPLLEHRIRDDEKRMRPLPGLGGRAWAKVMRIGVEEGMRYRCK